MKKYIKYILIVFLISVGIGLVLSYVMKSRDSGISAQNISGNTIDVGSSNEDIIQTSSTTPKITQDTKIIVETKYQDCKHTKTQEYEAIDELINLTEEELEEKYPDIIVTDFSEEEVSLYLLEEGLCGEHFKITIDDENDRVVVYRLTSNYDVTLYDTTDISTEYLTSDDLESLEEGIYIYGIANLNSTLESFE